MAMAHFTDLPREIRDIIYQRCLLRHEPINFFSCSPGNERTAGLSERRRKNADWPFDALLRVNKQIYAEAAQVALGSNRWIVWGPQGVLQTRRAARFWKRYQDFTRHIQIDPGEYHKDIPDHYSPVHHHFIDTHVQIMKTSMRYVRQNMPYVRTVTINTGHLSRNECTGQKVLNQTEDLFKEVIRPEAIMPGFKTNGQFKLLDECPPVILVFSDDGRVIRVKGLPSWRVFIRMYKGWNLSREKLASVETA